MGYSARRGFSNGKVSGAARQAEMQAKIAQMQEQMNAAQESVEAQVFSASVGGGVVEAKVNGKKEVVAINIKPEAVDPEDVEMLQDLVVSAVNEALRQAGDAMEKSMNSVTGSLNLGAFGLYKETDSLHGSMQAVLAVRRTHEKETDFGLSAGLPAAGGMWATSDRPRRCRSMGYESRCREGHFLCAAG